MLDLKLLQKQPEIVREALRRRRSDIDVAEFESLDARRRALLAEVESLKAERNTASGEIAKRKRAGEDASDLIERMGGISDRIKFLDEENGEVGEELRRWMLAVPNMPHESVPDGESEDDNEEISRWGTPRNFDFEPQDHHDIGTALGGLDFERAAKLAGSRFVVMRGQLARMERALATYMLDLHTGCHGYSECITPAITNTASLTGTGQLPKFSEDLFKLENSDYYLIPTAEVTLTNLHRDEVLAEEDLPLDYVAWTPCFRSEAGSYGRDTRGIIRQHQFGKVELVRIVHPDKSFEALEGLRENAETVLRNLELPYRTVTLCTGDLGFSAVKTYDLEVWLPGQQKYREISSCSNTCDFQARRANIRFRPADSKKPQFVHTLNGSGLAVGRTLVAVLENYQQKDGSVIIPDVLRPYMGNLEIIEPK